MNFVPLPRGRWPGEHQFYFGMALALLAAVVLGFARSFFLRPLFPDHPSPPETVFYWHGAVFTAWFVLFSVQPYLIASGRVAAHRALGRGGAVLAAVMVVFGCYVAVVAAARPDGFIGLPIPPFNFLIVPLAVRFHQERRPAGILRRAGSLSAGPRMLGSCIATPAAHRNGARRPAADRLPAVAAGGLWQRRLVAIRGVADGARLLIR